MNLRRIFEGIAGGVKIERVKIAGACKKFRVRFWIVTGGMKNWGLKAMRAEFKYKRSIVRRQLSVVGSDGRRGGLVRMLKIAGKS
jgi:hypothetical protein